MKMKRGQTESLSLLTGLIIMTLIIAAIALFGYNLAKGNVDVRAEVIYEDFVEYYKECLSYDESDCYCDVFDFDMPFRYEIQLHMLDKNQIAVSLMKEGLNKPFIKKALQGREDLCIYNYGSKEFIETKFDKLSFPSNYANNIPYAVFSDKLNVYLSNKSVCLVPASFFEALFKEKNSCKRKKISPKLDLNLLIHLRHNWDSGYGKRYHPLTSSAKEHINNYFSQLGKFYILDEGEGLGFGYQHDPLYKHKTGQEVSKEELDKLYSEIDKFVVISFLSDYDGKAKGDYISLKYIEDSERSKLLLGYVEKSLKELIANKEKPSFNLEIKKSAYVEDPDFLITHSLGKKSYGKKEELAILIIDFIETDQVGPLLEGNEEMLIEAVFSGVKQFLDEEGLSLGKKFKEKEENLFK